MFDLISGNGFAQEFLGSSCKVVIFVTEHRIKTNDIAKRVSDIHVESKTLVAEYVAERTDIGRINATRIFEELKFLGISSTDRIRSSSTPAV